MKYDFDNIPRREGTDCYKYDKRKEIFGRPDVIPMWVADMDFSVAPFITDTIKNRAEHDVYGYDFRRDGFFDSVMGWAARRNNWRIERDWIVFTPGVVAGMVFAELAFTEQGDGIVIQPPIYPPFSKTVLANSRNLIHNPLKAAPHGYGIDFDDLDKKLTGAKAFMLCNPHNPTGRVFTRDELLRVGELCIKHDVVIISDEIHSDLIYSPYRHTHIASLSPELAARTVTLMAPSKTFNIAGLSTSVAVIPDAALREKFSAVAGRMHVGDGTVFGALAFEAAYSHGDLWLDQLMVYLTANRDYLQGFVADKLPSVKIYPAEGTYLLWMDFSKLGMTHNELIDFLIFKAGLGLNDGFQFGKEGLQHARMNIATSRAVIKKAMEQLYEAFTRL